MPRAEGTRPCETCATPVDPLRAERVAFIRERFRYFCSVACRERFDASARMTPIPTSRLHTPAPRLHTPRPSGFPVAEAPVLDGGHATARAVAEVAREPLGRSDGDRRSRTPRPAPAPARSELLPLDGAGVPASGASGLLLGVATLGSALSLGLVLAGDSRVVLAARVILAAVACAAFVTERTTNARDPSDLHPATSSMAPVAASGVSWAALLFADPLTSEAATLTSVIVALAALGAGLLGRARRPLDAERRRIAESLDGTCRRVVDEEVVSVRTIDLRPGEEILLERDDLVPADVAITAGDGSVLPWLDAKSARPVTEGDVLVAGARVVDGRLRAIVGWAGNDRAWLRLTNDARRRADLHASLARNGRLFAERGAPLAAGLGALTAFAAGLGGIETLLVAAAVHAACAYPVTAAAAARRVAEAVLACLRRGVAFRSAGALDRAGRVSTVVFCARGTLLLGEPEVASIEALGDSDASEVLALVAGAESSEQRPLASAVLRAARARNVRPDAIRSPRVHAGLGVTAIASNGQPLVVGSRALALQERVSVAIAERRITELEALGQTVLLVALGGKLVGLVGLQDGLMAGARPAVQHVLDAGMEPVLLSGDARETCDALGRALGIEHLRPEVPPTELGDEVKRLIDGGATVAVVGRSPADDRALGAADVAVALGSAGSTAADFSVQLATDDARDAAFALHAARDCLKKSRLDLALCIAPALAASAIAALGLGPAALVPLAAAAGSLLTLAR
ncbi:MAG TPA: HAD family hydrolase [Polyangiaceae bacterium]